MGGFAKSGTHHGREAHMLGYTTSTPRLDVDATSARDYEVTISTCGELGIGWCGAAQPGRAGSAAAVA